MRTIFKTKLHICDVQTIEVPQDYKIIHLALQEGTPCIWYECTTEVPLVKVEIYCYGTGFNMDNEPTSLEHIGSIVTRDDFFVWHFYRKL